MSHTIEKEHEQKTRRTRELNDQLRRAGVGGNVVSTPGVLALGADAIAAILTAVAAYDDFDEDNDPHGEHDFGLVEIGGHDVLFKIDYYDSDLKFHSPDASDPVRTRRVMTIFLSDEY